MCTDVQMHSLIPSIKSCQHKHGIYQIEVENYVLRHVHFWYTYALVFYLGERKRKWGKVVIKINAQLRLLLPESCLLSLCLNNVAKVLVLNIRQILLILKRKVCFFLCDFLIISKFSIKLIMIAFPNHRQYGLPIHPS